LSGGPEKIVKMFRTELTSLPSLYHIAQVDFDNFDWQSIWAQFNSEDIAQWLNIEQYDDDFNSNLVDQENYQDFATWNLVGKVLDDSMTGKLNRFNHYMIANIKVFLGTIKS